ncbi:hypothetical protein HJG60_001901 [Phyllostomus discolor]|nr:hypothetical protein HJG60_001901 [Phyllostomus discolor]
MEEVQKRTNMLLLKEALHLEQEHKLQQYFSEEEPAQQGRVLKREELENLIKEAIHIQIECLQELLQYEIQVTYDILDLKLRKKTLKLNAPVPFPLSITGQPGQDESLKFNKANKGKKEKGKRAKGKK